MSRSIIWSPRARKNYITILDFILKKWSDKEAKSFADKTSSAILKIAKNPEMFVSFFKSKKIRKGFITNTLLQDKVRRN